MTNTRTFTLIRVVFLALAATVASVGLLSAEDYSGTFTLPFETKWGTATLPPGEYTFKLNIDVAPHTVKVVGKNGAAFAMPWRRSETKAPDHSALIIVRHGRRGTVRALRLAEEGLIFTYYVPGGERRMLAQEP